MGRGGQLGGHGTGGVGAVPRPPEQSAWQSSVWSRPRWSCRKSCASRAPVWAAGGGRRWGRPPAWVALIVSCMITALARKHNGDDYSALSILTLVGVPSRTGGAERPELGPPKDPTFGEVVPGVYASVEH